MAPANAKPWKQQQAPILVVAALLLLGLALPVPGSAAPLYACYSGFRALRRSSLWSSVPDSYKQCTRTVLDGLGSLSGTSTISKEDVGKCCNHLKEVIFLSGSRKDDCACGLLKALAERKIDVDEVLCELSMTKEKCQTKEDAEKAKADAAAAAAKAKADAVQQREDELTNLGACDRMFERLVAGELSKIRRVEDIMACRQEMKTCPATCKVQQ